MLFDERIDGAIQCTAYDDIDGEDKMVGLIQKFDDGYWRFVPICEPMTAGDLKAVVSEVSKRNAEGI